MKNVLITGGAGFIGIHLSRSLLKRGFNVVAYDNLSPQIHGDNVSAPAVDGLKFVLGDIRDTEKLRSLVTDIDVVYHLAAETGTAQSMYELERYVSVNDAGTACLLEALSTRKKKRIDFVLASSRSIYGEGHYLSRAGDRLQPKPRTPDQLASGIWNILDEDGFELTPVATTEVASPVPSSIYAATKYSQEMLVKVASDALGLRSTVLRFQNVYGNGQSLRNPYTGIISIFYNRMRQGLPIEIYEDGLESRDFVYVSDVVDALVASIDRNGDENLTLNVGSGVPTSVIELAETLSSVAQINADIQITGNYRVGDIRHCFADLRRPMKYLGYESRVSLVDGLEKFCEWSSMQPKYEDKSSDALNALRRAGLAE